MLSTGQLANAHASKKAQSRPNIIWINVEDISPDLACYNTPAVRTPVVDMLAKEGIRFTNAFTTSPICSPSRSAIATGMYQTSIGAHHHRSHRDDNYRLPKHIGLLPEYLRQAGYYTLKLQKPAPGAFGSGKDDYNFAYDSPWDSTEDWSGRKPGQPFFAKWTISRTHHGVGKREKLAEEVKNRVGPNKVQLPPYLADHPAVRKEWATYLDSIQLVDEYIGKLLERLEKEGIADNTVIIFIGDHGRGNLRCKEWLYDGGIHIPLIIRWPGRLKAGQVRDEMISAIDITATVMKIVGLEVPSHMHGRPFLVRGDTDAWTVKCVREYIFAARDLSGSAHERIRCVRSRKFKYIRNFTHDKPYSAGWAKSTYDSYKTMLKLYEQGKLTPEQSRFLASPVKPKEELYDITNDPYEMNNLANSPVH